MSFVPEICEENPSVALGRADQASKIGFELGGRWRRGQVGVGVHGVWGYMTYEGVGGVQDH